MSDELKPCPFCGSTTYVQLRKSPAANGMRWVYCSNCLTDGPPKPTPEMAIEAWNTRDNAQNAALLAAAKGWLAIYGHNVIPHSEYGRALDTLRAAIQDAEARP